MAGPAIAGILGILIMLLPIATLVMVLIGWIIIRAKTRQGFVWWPILGCIFIMVGGLLSILAPLMMMGGSRYGGPNPVVLVFIAGLMLGGLVIQGIAFIRLAVRIESLRDPRAERRERRAQGQEEVW